MREEIAIWGTGNVAAKFFYRCRARYDIKCFFDNSDKKIGSTFLGLPVKKFNLSYKFKIVIASSYWREIKKQLDEQGLQYGSDYLYYWSMDYVKNISYAKFYETNICSVWRQSDFYKKKLALIYGNCQTGILEKIMIQYKQFSEEYVLVKAYKVFEYVNKRQEMEHWINDLKFWKKVDLFIYQRVKSDNKFSPMLATDNILKKLKSDCIKIEISNIFFKGYFPQIMKNEKNILLDVHQSGLFPFGDKYVIRLLETEKKETILNRIMDVDFIPSLDIQENIEESFNELEKREFFSDVKILDFLKDNYKKEQLFYSTNHPTRKVMEEYCNRIMAFLGFEAEELSEADYSIEVNSLKGQDIPIYPSVISYLGLEKYEKRYYPNRYLYDDLVFNFQEFIYAYIMSLE